MDVLNLDFQITNKTSDSCAVKCTYHGL